jgi:hypothetical protein
MNVGVWREQRIDKGSCVGDELLGRLSAAAMEFSPDEK